MKARFASVIVFALLISQLLGSVTAPLTSQAAIVGWPDAWQADSSFFHVWARADEPVAMQTAPRSWLWGPVPFAVADEAYAESPTGKRLVEYMDKARMEVNDPSGDRSANWFVTTGLLVSEMVMGQVQIGNNTFEGHAPASVVVAGDPNSPAAPTYASFATLLGPTARQAGKLVQGHVGSDGAVTELAGGDLPSSDPHMAGLTSYDEVSKHNVPAVFADWMAQRGQVLEGGKLVTGALMDPLFVLGRPITEAYWADVLVGGKPQRVMLQLFERRALTYNPANEPQWRVEMANVGRAYYSWRYAEAAPGPAISAEVTEAGLVVGGWNWPTDRAVTVEVDLAGGSAPLATSLDNHPGADGHWTAQLPLEAALRDALLSGANVKVVAYAGDANVALPIAAKLASGSVKLEGVLTQVEAGGQSGQGGYAVRLRARDGREWAVQVGASTPVSYSEGSAAPAGVLQPGMAVSIEGVVAGASVNAGKVALLSVSKTGAQFAYAVQPDGKSVRVSGTGWPAEKPVAFTIRRLDSAQGAAVGTVRADSRGNLTGALGLPASNGLPSGSLWLFAQSSDKGAVLAGCALPLDLVPASTQSGSAGPPRLSLLVRSGEQVGKLGSYCWGGACSSAIGVPLPSDALQVGMREVLGFRSQLGPDPETGVTPLALSGQLYPYPEGASGGGTLLDGILYFNATAPPLLSTGDLPGRPFSVSMPPTLASGKYVLVMTVGWPGPSGAKENSTYGFTVELR